MQGFPRLSQVTNFYTCWQVLTGMTPLNALSHSCFLVTVA